MLAETEVIPESQYRTQKPSSSRHARTESKLVWKAQSYWRWVMLWLLLLDLCYCAVAKLMNGFVLQHQRFVSCRAPDAVPNF
jgi:hypothetical protein